MAFRRKRSDTRVSTIEDTYGVDFGVRGDMKLGTLLDITGARSLTDLVRNTEPEPDWQRTERAACARRGMRHRGGPGEPDCDGPGKVVEVKDHGRPITGSQVRDIAAKPWARGRSVEIVSTSGYTDSARDVARRLGIKLRRS